MPSARAQEPVEDVEQLGDVGELCGADRYGGSVRVWLLAIIRNRLCKSNSHYFGPRYVLLFGLHRLVAVVALRRVSAAA